MPHLISLTDVALPMTHYTKAKMHSMKYTIKDHEIPSSSLYFVSLESSLYRLTLWVSARAAQPIRYMEYVKIRTRHHAVMAIILPVIAMVQQMYQASEEQ
jgi:hypothetical protein